MNPTTEGEFALCALKVSFLIYDADVSSYLEISLKQRVILSFEKYVSNSSYFYCIQRPAYEI